MDAPADTAYIAWTTLPDGPLAEALAREVIELDRAACAQVDGPITSVYRWEGQIESAREWRLTLKCRVDQLDELERWIHRRHPFQVPQWIVVRAEHVSAAYLSWMRQA